VARQETSRGSNRQRSLLNAFKFLIRVIFLACAMREGKSGFGLWSRHSSGSGSPHFSLRSSLRKAVSSYLFLRRDMVYDHYAALSIVFKWHCHLNLGRSASRHRNVYSKDFRASGRESLKRKNKFPNHIARSFLDIIRHIHSHAFSK